MFLSHGGVHDLKKELGAENSFDGIEQYRSETVGSMGLLCYFAHTCEIQNSIYVNILRLRRNELPQDPLSKFLSSGFSRSRNYRFGCNDIVNACG